jgi:hypothetical protein
MEALWEKQFESRIENRLSQRMEEQGTQLAKAQRVDAEIARYKQLIPDVMVAGTEARNRVQTEVDFIASVDGKPKNAAEGLSMELKALRAAFGPPDRVEEQTRKARETHQQTGGGAKPDTDEGGKVPKISNRLKGYYKMKIDQGLYSGWDDPVLKEELKYARTTT